MARLLRLSEFETRQCHLSATQAKRLNDTGFLSVVPDSEPGRWQVTAGHHVGTLVVGDLHLYVRPKIRLENLFLLLSVGVREQDWRRPATRYAIDSDLLPAVISFFTRLVDSTLAKGGVSLVPRRTGSALHCARSDRRPGPDHSGRGCSSGGLPLW